MISTMPQQLLPKALEYGIPGAAELDVASIPIGYARS